MVVIVVPVAPLMAPGCAAAVGLSFGWGGGYGGLGAGTTFLHDDESASTVGPHLRFML